MPFHLGDRINVYRSKTTIYCEYKDNRYEIEWSEDNKEIIRNAEDLYGFFLGNVLYLTGEMEHDNFLKHKEYVCNILKTMVEW